MTTDQSLKFVFKQNDQQVTILEENVIEMFHHIYYGKRNTTWMNTHFLGQPVWKCPLDLWVFQEIIFEIKPDVIIETGTLFGGSAYYYASLCDLLGNGKIVTIDIMSNPSFPKHERINYILGSSIAAEIESEVSEQINEGDRILVILDSDHAKDHVLKELEIYSNFVSPGSYLIVEDSNVNGHPVRLDHGEGPYEAVQSFLEQDKRFVVDEARQKFMLTFNPSGFLKRVA